MQIKLTVTKKQLHRLQVLAEIAGMSIDQYVGHLVDKDFVSELEKQEDVQWDDK